VANFVKAILLPEEVEEPRFYLETRVAIVDSLVGLLGSEASPDENVNASALLCELVTRSQSVNSWSFLVARLVTPENLDRIFAFTDSQASSNAALGLLNVIFASPMFSQISTMEYEKMLEGTGTDEPSAEDDMVLMEEAPTPLLVTKLVETLPRFLQMLDVDTSAEITA
jgi:hypothetical protein